MATVMDGKLAKQVIAAIATVSADVLAHLPETVTTPFGTHDVWYAIDDDGLYACVECWPLFGGYVLVSEYDDRDSFGVIGWRIDLDRAKLAELEERGYDVADHTHN